MKNYLPKIFYIYIVILPIFAAKKADLVSFYNDSLINDGTLASQQAEFMASSEARPLAFSEILPVISASGSWNRNNNKFTNNLSNSSPQLSDNKYSGEYTLGLSQPIFDLVKFQKISKASITVRKSFAILQNQFQEFIIRVANSYIDALKAIDNLELAKSEEKALKRQLTQTEHRFQVGLETKTSIYSAQAAYDTAVANTIDKENLLTNSMSSLSVLSGTTYHKIKEFKNRVPIAKPKPTNHKKWILKALTQNYELLVAQYDKEIAKKDVSISKSKHFPIINANASYTKSRFSNRTNPYQGTNSKNRLSNINLKLTLPIYSGGSTIAGTRKSSQSYLASVSKYEQARRNLENKTLQTYNKLIAKFHQINALKQAVKSANSANVSTQESYKQGSSTIVDLLTSQKDVFIAKQALSACIYDYLLESLTLKKLAGTLSEEDLQSLNKYLS